MTPWIHRMFLCGLAVVLSAPAARSDSIWARGSRRTQATYSDDTARDRGDSLTIIINERSKIENETTRSMEKKDARDATMDGTLDPANILWPVGKHIFDFPKVKFGSSANNKFDGTAAYDNDRSVIDQVTVTIEDVLPNGNMVVLGQRVRRIDGDEQIVQVSGIVRASDITFANTVRSDQVAQFRIVYLGKGLQVRFTEPGWLARAMNFLNPF